MVALATAVVLIVAPGCARKAQKVTTRLSEGKLVGEVDNYQISRDQLEEILEHMSDTQRQTYATPEGLAKLTQHLMQEEIAYREAQKMGLAQHEDVAKQIEQATRQILVAKYMDDVVDAKARPSDEELHEYYDSHQDLYTQPERLRAQHIFSKDKAKLEDLKRRVEEGGEKFTTLAQTYSEDPITKAEGGDLGYFNPGGYIKGIGFSKTFNDQVSLMEKGKIYGPIKWEEGYSLVRINDKVPAEVSPYEDVRDDIAHRMAADKLEDVRNQHFVQVEKNYKTRNLLQEKLDKNQRSPQELFDFAQNSHDAALRIDAFQQIVDKFPTDKAAPQAMFMIGFVYAEEMQDRVMAQRTFTSLIEKYPDSDMARTARWMLDNEDEPMPKFQDLDDLNKQIEKKKGS
jgi:EpsD family peptidyl-prolyl cis-trans isomerase